MQHPLASILISALVGGLSATLAMTLLTGERDSARGPARPAGSASSSEASAWENRIAELELRNGELELRLANLEGRDPATRQPAQAGLSSVDNGSVSGSQRIERELEMLRRTLAPEGRVPELFVARVGEALEEIRIQEAREEEELLRQAREERVEERVARWTEELGLSSYQVDEMRVILQAEETRRGELFQSAAPGNRFGMREGMREISSASHEALRGVLSESQFEVYREQSRDGFGPDGGDRGRERRDDGNDAEPGDVGGRRGEGGARSGGRRRD